jgi:predicted CopG family antitoxin
VYIFKFEPPISNVKMKMSLKSVSLSEEVYARLEAEKKEGESISDVITRLIEKKSLLNIVGFLKEEEAEEMEEVIRVMREKSKSTSCDDIIPTVGTSFGYSRRDVQSNIREVKRTFWTRPTI